MKKISILSVLLFPVFVSSAQERACIRDVLNLAASAELEGYVGNKLDLSYTNRIMVQDDERLAGPFLTKDEEQFWQTEFWGKWFTSAVLAYRYKPTPMLERKLQRTVAALIGAQTTEGYLGNYNERRRLEGWDIWGRKYCMLGLIGWYDITGDKDALAAAARAADHLAAELTDQGAMIVQKGAHRGMAASSVLEPLCLLYSRTGEGRFLEFADEIVRQWETPQGPQLISKAAVDVALRFPRPAEWYGAEQGQKAYEMMSCYEGLAELYRLTGRKEYLDALEQTWENIRDTEINIAGSGTAMECWFGGRDKQAMAIYHYQETCVTATWIKLSYQLLRLTGRVRYTEAIEESYYNALLAAMRPDGSAWAYYSPLLSGYRVEREEQCGMGTNCCNASGPRALFLFPAAAVMEYNDGIRMNLFCEGTYRLTTPSGKPFTLTQLTSYPEDGRIRLRLEVKKAEEFDVAIRIPHWSVETQLSWEGERQPVPPAGELLTLRRKWKSGDTIELDLDMRGRIVEHGGRREYVAFMRGPIVLARDSRLGGPVFDTWVRPVTDEEGYLKMEAVAPARDDIWMQFEVQAACESSTTVYTEPHTLPVCDFSSAGNTYDAGSRFRVWLDRLYDPSVD